MRTVVLILIMSIVNVCTGQNIRASHQVCNCKIILIGEEHKFKENYAITNAFLSELHSKKVFPKYILLERGQGTASLLNRYLKTGDHKILSTVFPLKEDQLFYMKLASIDSSLSNINKFEFLGVDYDYSYEIIYSSLQYILLSEAERLEKASTSVPFEILEEDDKYNYLIKSLINKKDPDTWSHNDLKKDINLILYILNSKDSLLLLKRAGENIGELKMILAGYQLTNDSKHPFIYNLESKVFKEKREAFMAQNIYSLFERDTAAIIFGQFGSFHTLFKSDRYENGKKIYDRFADALNSNKDSFPLTNSKVCTNIIIYKRLLKKQSRYYNLNSEKLTNDYKSLDSGKLFIQSYPDNTILNNILILKI